MDKIAERLKAYIDTRPFDSDDGVYETVWSSSTKPMLNPVSVTHRKSATA